MRYDSAVYQCIPNFSEGRRPETVAAIVAAGASVEGVRVIDWSSDPDHNRSVVTILGGAEPVRNAVLAMARVAAAEIDLRKHTGVHPRIGAIDVVPVVPLRSASREDAINLANQMASDIGSRLHIPVYLYEWSGSGTRALPEVRRLLKSAGSAAAIELTGALSPDFGPPIPHPSAGVTVVGARGPLVAYNIDLDSGNISASQKIARTIRRERHNVPFLNGVRALGLFLPHRGCAQISMNLTMPAVSTLPAVWGFVRAQALRVHVHAIRSEIIGIIPSTCLAGAVPADICWLDYTPLKLIETWLDA